jgi:hypothetical protein
MTCSRSEPSSEDWDAEDPDEPSAKTDAELKPGDECEVRQVYRCVHCYKIKPWSNGGGGASDIDLSEEEELYLQECCDECWCAILPPMEDAVRRLIPPKGQLALTFDLETYGVHRTRTISRSE